MSLIFRLTGSRVSSHCSQFLKRDSTKLINYVRSVSLNPTQAVTPPKEGHDERNMRLLRPQSPHLTIYKPQLTSMLSISHRFTGIILTSYAVALSMAAVYLECPIEFYIEKLRCAEIGAGPIYAIKFLLAFPLTYHFWNGIRHLLWDTAKFLTIKEVYLTGWTMLVIALISAAILSGMFKMYTYERVRARHFSRTWGYVQFSQALPIAIGVPFSGYLNDEFGNRTGYYFSSICTLIGSLSLFLTDLHRHRISHHKHTRENGTRQVCSNESCPQHRKLSFSQEPDNDHHHHHHQSAAAATAFILGGGGEAGQNNNSGGGGGGVTDNLIVGGSGCDKNNELTCISEEGIADMDLPDDLLADLDYIGDCITSCNKVENYLMLSEFENNLFAEMPSVLDRRGRRWSLAGFLHNNKDASADKKNDDDDDDDEHQVEAETATVAGRFSKLNFLANKIMTVVDESSV